MFHFFGFLLIIILALVLIGFGILMSVVRSVFRLGKGGNAGRQTSNSWQAAAGASQTAEKERHEGRRPTVNVSDDGTVTVEEGELHINPKKIFGKDEGEYVNYEEVKD